MKSLELIDRYIPEIGKHLPLKDRGDIQKEIRSTLEDMLEDRAKQAGREPDEDMVVALLKEFGRPEDVAASYMPERTLIGPQLYPFFSLVCWIALSTLGAVLVITLGIGLFSAGLTPLETFKEVGSLLLQVGGALVSAFGSIVITFAILERVFGKKQIKVKGELLEAVPGLKLTVEGEEKDWDPRGLPEVQDVEKFSIPGLVAEIVFTLFAIAIFNFYPQIIGFGFVLNGAWTNLPILSEAFFHYLPYLTGLWILQIVLDLILIRQGRWQTATRWASFGLKAMGLALAAVMLAGPELIGSTAEALAQAAPNISSDAVRILTWMPRLAVKLALTLAIILGGVELIKSIFQAISGKTRS